MESKFAQNAAEESAALLKWSKSPAVPVEFPFTSSPGMQVEPVNPVEHPISYFELIFTKNILKTIVASTNAFALQSNSNWLKTTAKEMSQLLGVFIYKNNLKHFPSPTQSDEENLKMAKNFPFRPKMSRDRFVDLCVNLRFGNEEKFCPEEAAGLLGPLIEALREQIATVYHPTRNLSILNETLEFPRNPDTPAVAEEEILKLHDVNGFIYNFVILKNVGLTRNSLGTTVEKLVESLSGRGHSLYLKSDFNSVQLALNLLRQKTYLTGTYLPEVSANFPPEMFSAPSRPIQLQCEGVFVEKIFHQKMTTISTEMANETSTSRIPETSSRLAQNYRKVLESIYYRAEFKDIMPKVSVSFPYSTKVFVYLLNICAQNAFVLYSNRTRARRLKYVEFKFLLAQQLQERI